MPEGGFLSLSASVGLTTLLIETTFVTNTNGVLIVVACMGTDEILMAGLIDRSITGDVIMIAGEPEAGVVTGNEVLDGEPTVSASGAAVDDDEIYLTHDCTKNVVMTRVMSDPTNFRIFPILV